RYHKMIAEVQDYAIILLNKEGIIENWNVGAENIKGYTAKEIVGKSFEVFYTEEDRKNELPSRLLSIARETGKALQEGWRVRKNGSKFWGSITITALHNNEGNIIGYSKVTRDMTLQKEAQEKLAVYLANLEIQNSELEQFAYVASHDLQEPLRKIQTFTELIQENYDDKEFVITYLKKLDSSATRMAALVKSLLEYSRLSKHTITMETEPVDLNFVLSEVREDFELLISEKNARIMSEPLPFVNGNHVQLRQLFYNLIGNSLKFSSENPLIEITAAVVGKDSIPDAPKILTKHEYIRISFKDNGIGFEKQYNKTIFSLFKRLHSKNEYEGTGIGLAICKKIVENHNGYICAISELGKGAVFNVYLPNSEDLK
ncbi:MAG TPA: ATP-binding protein, partial [Flavobacteriales bacterium]|nr:ATP-binding protein [Flavobacteriales bacterium]